MSTKAAGVDGEAAGYQVRETGLADSGCMGIDSGNL